MNNEILNVSDIFRNCKEFRSISRLYKNNIEDSIVLNRLLSTNPDLMSFTQINKDLYTKVFMIMCSNAFEKRMTEILPLILSGEINKQKKTELSEELTEDNYMSSFLKRNSFNNKFHTLFEWKLEKNKRNDISKMLGMFGSNFKDEIRKALNENPDLSEGEKRFIIIGRYRNLLVHNGIYDETLPPHIDLDYIYKSYKLALDFMSFTLDIINKKINGDGGN